MKKLTIFVGGLALLAASCATSSSEIDSTPVIEEVLRTVAAAPTSTATQPAPTATQPAPTATQPVPDATEPPPIEVPEGCELVTELDEYGFEVEVIKCGEDREPPPENPDWLGSTAAKKAAKLLREALVTQSACGTRVSYGELKTLIAEAPAPMSTPLLEAVAALEVGSAHCNKDKDAWAAAMTEAIVNLESFLQAAAASAPPDVAADEDPP